MRTKRETKDDWRERDATAFAMALLMPEATLRADVDGTYEGVLSDADIAALAKRYQVEQSVMTLRLVRLGYLR